MRILPFLDSPPGIVAREGPPAPDLEGPPCCPDHEPSVGFGLADPAAADRVGLASPSRPPDAAATKPGGAAAAPGSDAFVDRGEPGPAGTVAPRGRRGRVFRRAPAGSEPSGTSFPAVVAAALGPSTGIGAADSSTRRVGATVRDPAPPPLVPGSADGGFAAWLAAVIPVWAPGSGVVPLVVRSHGRAPATPEAVAAASPANGVANAPGSGAVDSGGPGPGIATAGSPPGPRGAPRAAHPSEPHPSEPGPSEPGPSEPPGTDVRPAAARAGRAEPALADPPASPTAPSGPRTSASAPAPSAGPADPTPPPLPAGHPPAAPLAAPAGPALSLSEHPAAAHLTTPAPDTPAAVAGRNLLGGPSPSGEIAERAAEWATDPTDRDAARADVPRPHDRVPIEAPVRAPGRPSEPTSAVGSTDGPLPPPTREPVDRLFGLVATRIRQASREGLPTLEATFHEPALGTVRLSVRGLPDGPIVATLVVASEAVARALERARWDTASRPADLAAIDLRVRVDPGAGGAPVPDVRADQHPNRSHAGSGQPDPGPGAADADRREGAERGRGGDDAAVGRDGSASSGSARGDDRHGGLPGGAPSVPAVEPSTRARRRTGGVRPASGAVPAVAPPALRRPGGIDLRL